MTQNARQQLPATELRNVLERDVRAALDKLRARRHVDVHAVRKAIKHARAVVRLLLYELSDASYRRINLALRDAARPLARTRDTEVLLATIASLERKQRTTSLQPLHEALLREQRKSRSAGTTPRQIALARQHLETLRPAIAKLDVGTSTDWGAVIGAVGHTYRRGRKAARKACSDPTSDNLHEWRKQVKYLWHHVQILRALAPRRLQRLARDLHRLADHLGDDHDLALLRARIEQTSDIEEAARDDLKALLDRRRSRLEGKAYKSGRRLFDDKPKKFERKLRRYATSTRGFS